MTDEELAHYGVLGMKWGRNRAKATGSDIRSARRSVNKQAEAVSKQVDKVRRAPTGSAKKKESMRLDKMDAAYLKNPDRVIAARMTRGEKAASIVLSSLIVPGLGAIAGAGAIAGTSARSRRIERKQETGAYDKK
jgi:hypothetical protein